MKLTTSSFVLSFVAILAVISLNKRANATTVAPQFVYRADFRDPQTIFASGLKSVGDNVNLLEHVQGTSCSYGPNPSTAFVATTSEESFAEKWGGDQIWIDNDKGPNVFIYKIRATENFYSAYDSLLKAYRRTKEKKYQAAAAKYEYQKEWLAYNGIPTELILSAKVMAKAEPGKLRLLRTEQNRRYRSASTQGNPEPFNDPSRSSSIRLSLLSSRLPFLGSCFGSCRSGRRSDESAPNEDATPGSCPTKQIVFEVSSTAEKATVWDPLNKDARERIVPWEEETIVQGHVVEKPKNCDVIPGTSGSGHPLQITCLENRFYDSFVVLLKAGIGSETIVDTTFKDGITGKLWKKGAFRIPLAQDKGTLEDHKVSIAKVFHKFTIDAESWWSIIRVLPVYPDYIQKQG